MSATRNWCFGGLCTASARGGLVPRGVVPVVVDGLSGDGESDGEAGEEPSPNGSSGGGFAGLRGDFDRGDLAVPRADGSLSASPMASSIAAVVDGRAAKGCGFAISADV